MTGGPVWQLVSALADIEDERAVPHLVQAMDGPDLPEIICYKLGAYGSAAAERALPAVRKRLAAALEADDREAARHLLHALIKLGAAAEVIRCDVGQHVGMVAVDHPAGDCIEGDGAEVACRTPRVDRAVLPHDLDGSGGKVVPRLRVGENNARTVRERHPGLAVADDDSPPDVGTALLGHANDRRVRRPAGRQRLVRERRRRPDRLTTTRVTMMRFDRPPRRGET
jgi:hypothetical protein